MSQFPLTCFHLWPMQKKPYARTHHALTHVHIHSCTHSTKTIPNRCWFTKAFQLAPSNPCWPMGSKFGWQEGCYLNPYTHTHTHRTGSTVGQSLSLRLCVCVCVRVCVCWATAAGDRQWQTGRQLWKERITCARLLSCHILIPRHPLPPSPPMSALPDPQ